MRRLGFMNGLMNVKSVIYEHWTSSNVIEQDLPHYTNVILSYGTNYGCA